MPTKIFEIAYSTGMSGLCALSLFLSLSLALSRWDESTTRSETRDALWTNLREAAKALSSNTACHRKATTKLKAPSLCTAATAVTVKLQHNINASVSAVSAVHAGMPGRTLRENSTPRFLRGFLAWASQRHQLRCNWASITNNKYLITS